MLNLTVRRTHWWHYRPFVGSLTEIRLSIIFIEKYHRANVFFFKDHVMLFTCPYKNKINRTSFQNCERKKRGKINDKHTNVLTHSQIISVWSYPSVFQTIIQISQCQYKLNLSKCNVFIEIYQTSYIGAEGVLLLTHRKLTYVKLKSTCHKLYFHCFRNVYFVYIEDIYKYETAIEFR